MPLAVPPQTLGVLLLGRAFADGCSAMTGTEAVANGVPAFKPPEWRNAQATMAAVALLLAVMYLGISYLALVSGATPAASGESVLSQIGRSTFGLGPIYYVLQFSTMGILILAANTSFADFPRLSSILARDGYFPRQFAYRGERLAFNAGHHRPGPRLHRRPGGLWRRRQRPDPAVRHRRLHGLHPVADGHGPPLVRGAGDVAGGGAR